MIKGRIKTDNKRIFKDMLLEIIAHEEFEIISHSATHIKYYYVSKSGTRTLSELTLTA